MNKDIKLGLGVCVGAIALAIFMNAVLTSTPPYPCPGGAAMYQPNFGPKMSYQFVGCDYSVTK